MTSATITVMYTRSAEIIKKYSSFYVPNVGDIVIIADDHHVKVINRVFGTDDMNESVILLVTNIFKK